MAGDATNEETDNAGVRRRYSGQHDNEGLPGLHGDGVRTGVEGLGGTHRPSMDVARPISSGNDVPLTIMHDAVEQPQRTRLSADRSRTPPRPVAKRSLSDGRIEEVDEPTRRSKTKNLSLDTKVTTPGLTAAGSSVASSQSMVSPDAQSRAQATPVPPRGRQRGYSLRSSLFQRNMRDKSTEGAEVSIEMGAVGPSSSNGVSRQTSRQYPKPYPGKKSMETVVEISPAGDPDSDDELKLPYHEPYPGVRGVSALPNYQSWIQGRKGRFVDHPVWHSMRNCLSKTRKFVLRIQEIPPTKDGRHIVLDASTKQALVDERTGKGYIPNTIRSSRYNAWNFVPRQLFAQFSKLANFYFLCVSILQMIPGLSTTGTYTTIVPLLFFVALSMAKEGYDDLRRYRLDKAENNREATVQHASSSVNNQEVDSIDSVNWVKTKWHNVQVGDVIKLERDEPAPADIVLLHATGPNGIAYIETMALDGETNLKSKQTTTTLAKLCNTAKGISSCHAHFVVEDPNLDLYNFEGKVTTPEHGQTAPLTNNEIVYRGSVLRNTSEAIGIVIYTGEECKIRMNANKNPRIKAPALQAVVNKIVIVIVAFVLTLAIFNTVAYQIWKPRNERNAWYLTDAGVAFFPVLTSFVIMFNTMIPLSLYVSLEIVKLAQMFLLNDVDMYDEASNTPFEARTSTINEELGQVSYIFSDKTGTLTDNSMKFRKLSVAGTAWLHDVDLQGQDNGEILLHKKRKLKGKGKKPLRKSLASVTHKEALDIDEQENDVGQPSRKSTSQWQSSARPAKAQLELNTKDLIRYLQRRPYTVFARKARMLLLSMALCHTCLPEQQDGKLDFQASSPDELALVRAAHELGYLAVSRESSTLTIKSFPQGQRYEPVIEEYQVLDVIEFSSKRKRMSVLVRFPDGRVCVLCKGADTIVMQRLKLATLATQKVVEIEKRANKRKSLEAHEALRRKSENHERRSIGRPSFSRPSLSLSLGRTSAGGIPRTSMTGPRRRSVHNELSTWLSEREHDVDVLHEEDQSIYYSPRSSTQVLSRNSLAPSEARSSFQTDDEDDELVEEALVVDEPAVIERCFQHINDFATEGLRTLLYAHRFLDEQEYLTWKKVYHDATTSLVNRQDLIENAGDLIEQDLELGGATAIEDKLQKGVPEAIDKLRRASIKMWMLTGDKRETAINIGHSCRLIKDYSSVTILDYETGQVEQRIASTILDISNTRVAHSVIVIDGQTLALVEADKPLRTLFYELAVLADSVICCRASPSQKAGLVKAVRNRVKGSITLAIGDGANDIAMIQEAHVGIGITGKEGLQAARVSDYSIAQFRFLTKLLLVHGRWNYVRVCKYTVSTFYKEFLFYLTQALYQRWVGYTGSSLYESWSLSMFNTLFTSLPVIFMGIFEKDLLPQTLIAIPELYTKGQRNGGFNFKIFLGWIFMASTESMLIFFLMLGVYGQAIFTNDQSLYALGSLTFTACITLIVLKIQFIEIHNKSVMAIVAFVASVGGWFLWMLILSQTYSNNYQFHVKGSFTHSFGDNALWWLTLILILVATVWFEFGVLSLKSAYFTTDVDIFQELERDLHVRRRFEEASAMELQAGWHRGTKKSSFELQREHEEQVRREKEVTDLLNRPRIMEEGTATKAGVETEEERVLVVDGPLRRSTDIQEMLSRRFGSVK